MNNQKSLALTFHALAVTAALLTFISPASVDAAILSTSNSVVVLRVGDGATALAATAARVYLEEYAITFAAGQPVAATHVQTIPVPHLGATEGTKLLIGGTASVEGHMSVSANGQYFMFGGNNSFVGETNSGKRKVVGRLDMNGNVTMDAVYGPGTTAANNAMRAVASLDGNQYWIGEGGGAAGTPGIAYRTWEGGNNSGVQSVTLATQNTRRVEIYNGQLYMGSAASPIFGVATVGSGTPTSGSPTVSILPGMPTTTGPSTYDFLFADANTLYVADDRTSTSGGLQKWALESGTWVLKYTKNIGTGNGIRGLNGSVSGSGAVTLFATTSFGTTGVANFLVGMSDSLINTDPLQVSVATLASSALIPGSDGPNTTFRGLESIGIVIPEPNSVVLMAAASVLLWSVRRRRVR